MAGVEAESENQPNNRGGRLSESRLKPAGALPVAQGNPGLGGIADEVAAGAVEEAHDEVGFAAGADPTPRKSIAAR